MNFLNSFLSKNVSHEAKKESIEDFLKPERELDDASTKSLLELTVFCGEYQIKSFDVKNYFILDKQEVLVVEDKRGLVSYIPLKEIRELIYEKSLSFK